jgi:DNA-binding NarL/FixJ family response regulator
MLTPLDPAAARGPSITVVLVDDEHLIRGALADALTTDGLDVVGEAASAPDAVRLVVDLRPDVVLMDIRLPGMPGVQAIERLGLLAPASRILILTRTEQNRVVEAIVAGASGYILGSGEERNRN